MPSANFLTLDHNTNNSNSEDASAIERYMNLLNSQEQDAYSSNMGFSTLDPSFGSNPSLNQPNNFNMSNYAMPPYSTNKICNLQNQNTSNNEFRSLQNSPYYSHHGVSGNISNGPSTSSPGNSMFNSIFPETNKNSMRPLTNYQAGTGPFRELFTQNSSGGIPYHDRLQYYQLAQKYGFIVGSELERIKENSRRSMNQTYGRISAYFRNRYGETEAKTKASYLQLGVRVPSKDHVSEIVGKGGQKIKLIREETGALITTPGEHEDHVFIIEAPPEIALNVADHLAKRAREITQSKQIASEKRRGSAGSNPGTPSTGINHVPRVPSHGCLIDDASTITTNSAHLQGHHINVSNGVSLPGSPANGVQSVNMNGSTFEHQTAENIFLSNSSSMQPPVTPNFHASSVIQGGPGGNVGGRILLARGRISVPQDLVGKIIGTQGSIITTIQKDTGTEIKSPPKEAGRGPNATADFEISAYQGLGLTSAQAAEMRVQQAKQLIGHLVMRQLERRTSDDLIDDNASLATQTASNQTSNILSSMLSNNTSIYGAGLDALNIQSHWMWPDVIQMESSEAREVLDRILAESKNKTRRAKEMAGGSSSSPNTPGGPNGGSQTPDVFCEAAMNDTLMSHMHSSGSIIRTMSHPMPSNVNGCYDSPLMDQSSKNGTEIWIQNAIQQQPQKKHSTASLNLPSQNHLLPTQLARGVAEGCVDYQKQEWSHRSKSDHLSQLLENMMLKETGSHPNSENGGSPPRSNGDHGLSSMPPGFNGPPSNFVNGSWNNNGISYSLDFNKNKILPIGSNNSSYRCGDMPNQNTYSMIDKLFQGNDFQASHGKNAYENEFGAFLPSTRADLWATTPTDSAATPTVAFSNGKSFPSHVGAIGEGRRRSQTANQSASGSDEAP